MTTKVWFQVQGDIFTLLSFKCSVPVCLETIQQSFPLEGVWHFRAKTESPDFEHVWQDICHKDGPIPTYRDGQVHLRAFPVNVPAEHQVELAGDEADSCAPLPAVEAGDAIKRLVAETRPEESESKSFGLGSMLGKAMASSKAAMEVVRKNVT